MAALVMFESSDQRHSTTYAPAAGSARSERHRGLPRAQKPWRIQACPRLFKSMSLFRVCAGNACTACPRLCGVHTRKFAHYHCGPTFLFYVSMCESTKMEVGRYVVLHTTWLRLQLRWISGVVVLLQHIKVDMLVTVDTPSEFSLAMSISHKILRMYIDLTRPSV